MCETVNLQPLPLLSVSNFLYHLGINLQYQFSWTPEGRRPCKYMARRDSDQAGMRDPKTVQVIQRNEETEHQKLKTIATSTPIS